MAHPLAAIVAEYVATWEDDIGAPNGMGASVGGPESIGGMSSA